MRYGSPDRTARGSRPGGPLAELVRGPPPTSGRRPQAEIDLQAEPSALERLAAVQLGYLQEHPVAGAEDEGERRGAPMPRSVSNPGDGG
jgi:hypothetical protein